MPLAETLNLKPQTLTLPGMICSGFLRLRAEAVLVFWACKELAEVQTAQRAAGAAVGGEGLVRSWNVRVWVAALGFGGLSAAYHVRMV